MPKFRAIVTETQYYEVYVEADNEEEAEEIAEDTYGCDGDIFSSIVETTQIEEVTE